MKAFITVKLENTEYLVHYSQVYRNEVLAWFWKDKEVEIDSKTIENLEAKYDLLPTSKQMMESAMDKMRRY